MSSKLCFWNLSEMGTLLGPLLFTLLQVIAYGQAQSSTTSSTGERFEAPVNEATKSPFLHIYEYPIKGNNLTLYNDTHLFWPTRENLFSKFYMKFTYDNQEFYGISQQVWGENRAQNVYPEIPSSLGNNDHMFFVRAKGGIVDKKDDFIEMHKMDDDEPAEIPFFEKELNTLKTKARLLFPYFLKSQAANLKGRYYYMADHIPFMKNKMASVDPQEVLKELKGTMGLFGSNVIPKHLSGFQKSSQACLHMNIEGFQGLHEDNGRLGGWVPLNKNLLAFRVFYLYKPKIKLLIPSGFTSFHIDGKSVKNVFTGLQMFSSESEDGFQLSKSRLDIFNDGKPVTDSRPPAPLKPPALMLNKLKMLNEKLAINTCLPWASREKLCPKANLESIMANFKLLCSDLLHLPAASPEKQGKCREAYVQFFPCFSYFLRSTKKCSRGIDGIVDFRVSFHGLSEFPWDLIKQFATEKLLDSNFQKALRMFDDVEPKKQVEVVETKKEVEVDLKLKLKKLK